MDASSFITKISIIELVKKTEIELQIIIQYNKETGHFKDIAINFQIAKKTKGEPLIEDVIQEDEQRKIVFTQR